MKVLPDDVLALLPTLLFAASAAVFIVSRVADALAGSNPSPLRRNFTPALMATVVIVVVVAVVVLAATCLLEVADAGGFRFQQIGGFAGARLVSDVAPLAFRPFVPLMVEPLTAPMLLAVAVVGAAGNSGLALALKAGRVEATVLSAGLLLEATLVMLVLVADPKHIVAAVALSGVVAALALGLSGRGGGSVQLFGMQRCGDAGLVVALVVLSASLVDNAPLSFDSLAAAPALAPWDRLHSGAFHGFAHRTLWFVAAVGLVVGVCSRAGWLCWPWLRDATSDPGTPAPLLGLVHALAFQGCACILLVRLYPVIALAPEVQDGLVVVGASTTLIAALLALAGQDLRRVDAHLLAAFSGLMAICAGTQDVVGVALSGMLLMCAGLGLPWALSVVVERTGVCDPRSLGGLEPLLPRTHSTRLLLTAALAGLPPFVGFTVIHRALQAALLSERVHAVVVVVIVIGVVLMGLAGWRIVHLVFTGPPQAAPTATRVVEPALWFILPAWGVAFVAPALTLLAVPKGLLDLLPWEITFDSPLATFVQPSLSEGQPLIDLFAAQQVAPAVTPSVFAVWVLCLGLLPWVGSWRWWRGGRSVVVTTFDAAPPSASAVTGWLARLAGQDSGVARSVQESVERLSRLLALNLIPSVLSIALHRVPAVIAALTAYALRLLQNGGVQQAFFLTVLATAGLLYLLQRTG